MDRNTTPHFRNHQKVVWIAIAYTGVIAIVLYPALHEELGGRLFLWNCLPPTVGFLALATAFDKSRPRMVASVTFALLTGSVATFFSVVWFCTALDLDPHSVTTKLGFVFAPIFSPGLATIAASAVWFAARMSETAIAISEKERSRAS
jgi:hypothetical protein